MKKSITTAAACFALLLSAACDHAEYDGFDEDFASELEAAQDAELDGLPAEEEQLELTELEHWEELDAEEWPHADGLPAEEEQLELTELDHEEELDAEEWSGADELAAAPDASLGPAPSCLQRWIGYDYKVGRRFVRVRNNCGSERWFKVLLSGWPDGSCKPISPGNTLTHWYRNYSWIKFDGLWNC